MSKPLFETAYGNDRHVFREHEVFCFCGERELDDIPTLYADLCQSDFAGYLPTSYTQWFHIYTCHTYQER
jgi:hypothetical protein